MRDEAAELAARGELDRSVAAYRQVLAADAGDATSRLRLAEVLRRGGRLAEAVAEYAAAAERCAREGQLARAIALCKAILELDPAHDRTQATLAELYAAGPGAAGEALPDDATLGGGQPLPPGAPLPRVSLFGELSREAFLAVTAGLVLHRIPPGREVIHEGEAGTSLFLVAGGHLAVTRRNEAGDRVRLARLGEGDFFGEMGLLSGAPRHASVTAEDEVEVLELRAETLREVAARHPQLEAALRRFYRHRLLANAMALCPAFRPFSREDRRAVMRRFRLRGVGAGEVIVREGEPSDGLYVVLDGALGVWRRRGATTLQIAELREGDVFGEMSCLLKAPASATVTARREGALLRLPRAEFDALVLSNPQILEVVSQLTEERAESIDAILAGRAQWTEEGLVLL